MSTMLYLIYFVIVLICLYLHSRSRPSNFPPGPPRLPFWGSYWYLLWGDYKFPHNAMMQWSQKLKTDILGFYLGPYPSVVVFTHELCKEVLIRPEFQGRVDTYVPRLRGWGDLLGIFFTDGDFWKEQRRFSLRHMRDYGFGRRSDTMEQCVQEEVEYIIDILKNGVQFDEDKDLSTKKGEALMPDLLYAGFINAIWIVLAGDKFPRKDYRKLREIAQAALTFQRASDPTGGALTMTPWLKYIAPKTFGNTPIVESHTVLYNFMKEAIQSHKQNFSTDLQRDFIDVYLNEMKQIEETKEISSFSEEQLILITVDFLFPPATATTAVLGFLFLYLILNPDVQKKVQEEIDVVVGRNRLPTLNDRPMLPYTEATIREGMRIQPLNPLGLARKAMDDTTLGQYHIPKGTMIFPCLQSNNFEQNIWGDPENFRPERWLDDQGNLKKKDYTMPFGAGKRLCAGETFARQNMFLFFSGLIQNFTFETANGQKPDLTTHVPGFNVSPKEFMMKAVVRD